MRFRTTVYRESDPTEGIPVIIAYKGLSHVADPDSAGTFTSSCQLLLDVTVDRDTDGVPDVTSTIPQRDFPSRVDIDSAQFNALDTRLRGTGNFMQALRNFTKGYVEDWNQAVNPGSPTPTHTDLDTDSPPS